jgi:hypothetical protein
MRRANTSDDAIAHLLARAEKAVTHRHSIEAVRKLVIERLKQTGNARMPASRKHARFLKKPRDQEYQAEQGPEQVLRFETITKAIEPEPVKRIKAVSKAHEHLLDANASLIEREVTIAREIERLEGLKLEREAIARQIEALKLALQVVTNGFLVQPPTTAVIPEMTAEPEQLAFETTRTESSIRRCDGKHEPPEQPSVPAEMGTKGQPQRRRGPNWVITAIVAFVILLVMASSIQRLLP